MISTTQESMKSMTRLLFAFPIKLCDVAGIDYTVGCGRWGLLIIILQSFYFIHSITASPHPVEVSCNWELQQQICQKLLTFIHYSQSHLCYLDGLSGNYFHSHFNFWFCITCPALRWTYFHDSNQLYQLTFFSTSLPSLFLAIDWEMYDWFSIASCLLDIRCIFETI